MQQVTTPREKVFPLLIAAFFLALPVFVFADVIVDSAPHTTAADHNARYSNTVAIDEQNAYVFYMDATDVCAFATTTNGGASWSTSRRIMGTCNAMSVWYDRWTPGDASGNTIHIVTMDAADLYYSNVDTSTGATTTAVNATGANQAGTFAAGAETPSITKGTDGTLYMGISDAADSFVIECSTTCTSAGNWTETGTNPMDLASDGVILVPLASGNIMLINNDISADDYRSKVWNNAGASWDGSWTVIDPNAIENATYFPMMAATLRLSNNNIYLAYAGDAGTINAGDDVRVGLYNGSTWSTTTAVLNHAYGVQGVAVAYDNTTDRVYVGYVERGPGAAAASASTTAITADAALTSWSGTTTFSSKRGDIYGLSLNTMNSELIAASWYNHTDTDVFFSKVDDPFNFGKHALIKLTGNVRFMGNLVVTGALAKGLGTFVIDHPLYPKLKLLYHSFVESPEAKNIYDGVVRLDRNGEATVQLPDYFEALNGEYRYQFFPLKEPMPNLYIKKEVENNSFTIAGGVPRGKVSWQVTGNRHDPYIKANPIVPEVNKGPGQPVKRGEFLYEKYPELLKKGSE